MKADFNGIQVEGSVDEMVELVNKLNKKHDINIKLSQISAKSDGQ